MDPLKDIDMPGDNPGGADGDDSFSVEDFLRELEAKERDLHISADLDIEIEDDSLGEVPAFLLRDLEDMGVRAVEPHVAKGVADTDAERLRLETRISVLQSEISRKESARVELAEMLRRRQTDFENFKKRVDRDRDEQQTANIAGLVKGLLPVLDNLGRALDFAGPIAPGRSAEFRQFYEGIALVNSQMVGCLEALGVESVPGVGSHFDPTVHEAVAIEESSEFPANTVTLEMRRGYRIGDFVIRAAMVKVASASAEPQSKTEVPQGLGSSESDFMTFDEFGEDDILDLGSDDSSRGF